MCIEEILIQSRLNWNLGSFTKDATVIFPVNFVILLNDGE